MKFIRKESLRETFDRKPVKALSKTSVFEDEKNKLFEASLSSGADTRSLSKRIFSLKFSKKAAGCFKRTKKREEFYVIVKKGV